MYAVSDAFLTAIKKNTRRYYWAGKITTTGDSVYEFTQSDIACAQTAGLSACAPAIADRRF